MTSKVSIPKAKLASRPDLSAMWAARPGPKKRANQVLKELGGEFNRGWAQENIGDKGLSCAVRLSIALHAAGVVIPYIKHGTLKGSNGKNYIIRVNIMTKFLTEKFGPPDAKLTANKANRMRLNGVPGIIAFPGHVDLWNGLRIHGSEYWDNIPREQLPEEVASSVPKVGWVYFWGLRGNPFQSNIVLPDLKPGFSGAPITPPFMP